MYGRRKKRGRKWDFQGGGKRERKKSKKHKEQGANKNRAGTGIKGYGMQEV